MHPVIDNGTGARRRRWGLLRAGVPLFRRLAVVATVSAVLLILAGPSGVAEAHPSCSARDYTAGADYNYAYRPFSHRHPSPKESWILDSGRSSYGGPGAYLVYMVRQATPWWHPYPWYPPYKWVGKFCPGYGGWGD